LSLLKAGGPEGWTALIPLVYSELRRLAYAHLRKERGGASLQPTELVHEAYLRLIRQENVDWRSRTHFFGVAAHLMRLILVDQARKDKRLKRGGPMAVKADLSAVEPQLQPPGMEALSQALDRLAQLDPRQGLIVEMRYFSGMTAEETAEALGISEKTVRRDWTVARAWLHRELRKVHNGRQGAA
jgi:RNA polymerase sigma factor (TIGR02999 family)